MMLVHRKVVSSKTKKIRRIRRTRRTRNRLNFASKPRSIIRSPVDFVRLLKDLIILNGRLITPLSAALRSSTKRG